MALGSVYRNRHEWEASEASFLRALAADPDNPEAHQQYAEMLLDVGRIAEGRRSAERAVRLDAAPVRMVWHANGLELDGFVREAVEVTEAGLSEFPAYADLQIGLFYLYGLYPDTTSRTGSQSRVADSIRVEADRLRGGDLGVTVRRMDRELPYFWMAAGRRDSAIARLAAVAEEHMSPAFIWSPALDSLRAGPEYRRMLRHLNLEGATPRRTPR